MFFDPLFPCELLDLSLPQAAEKECRIETVVSEHDVLVIDECIDKVRRPSRLHRTPLGNDFVDRHLEVGTALSRPRRTADRHPLASHASSKLQMFFRIMADALEIEPIRNALPSFDFSSYVPIFGAWFPSRMLSNGPLK